MSTDVNVLPKPDVVPLDEWRTTMDEIERQEDAVFDAYLALAAARRRAPMTSVAGDYTFEGSEGSVSFADLFAGARQLVVYHFMFAPEWDAGCPDCTHFASALGPGINPRIIERDTRFILTSRAPVEKLRAHAAAHGIATPWYSAPREFSEEMGVINDGFGDFPGISVFFRDEDDAIYRTYKAGGRAIEAVMPATGILRLTPYGMQERGEDSPAGWPQRFDGM